MTSFDPTPEPRALIKTVRNFATSVLQTLIRSSDDSVLLPEESLRIGWRETSYQFPSYQGLPKQ